MFQAAALSTESKPHFYRELAAQARALLEGVSMQDAARRAVREYVERGAHRDRVAAAASRVVTAHAEALERLGE